MKISITTTSVLLGLVSAAQVAFAAALNGHTVATTGDDNPVDITLDSWPPFYKSSKPQSLCGDGHGFDLSSKDVPNYRDCEILRDEMDATPGYWNITADINRPDSFLLLATHGTCAFAAAPVDPNQNGL